MCACVWTDLFTQKALEWNSSWGSLSPGQREEFRALVDAKRAGVTDQQLKTKYAQEWAKVKP
jgi:hypothetical protein